MAKHFVGLGSLSNILFVKLLDSASTVGAGKTGLTSASSGLKISTICDNEVSATTYTSAGSTIESITTIGTYAAPTATKCRFKEVDASNHPGIYQLMLADARYAVANAKRLALSIQCTGVVEYDAEIELGMPPLSLPTSAFAPDGTASAATSTTLTLQSGQSYGTNLLAGREITITAGTGVGQVNVIKSNTNASASVLTMFNTWATTPDTTSQYVISGMADIFRGIPVELAGGLTAQKALSILLAGIAGEWTASGTFKTPDGTATRISGTAAGTAPFRSSITLTPSS